MFMYLIGTDWFKNNNPLSIAMTSVIKNIVKTKLILNIARPHFKNLFPYLIKFHNKKPTIAKSFHYPF